MKKDRNSFFQSSNFNMSAQASMPFNQVPYQGPYQMANPSVTAAQSGFYQANNVPMAYPVYPDMPTDLEAKIAKLERSINRLEARLNKLESSTFYPKDSYDNDGNMYIV